MFEFTFFFVVIPSIYTRFKHVAALSQSGVLYTSGKGKSGQLGHGDRESLHSMSPVLALSDVFPIVSVACGKDHTVAVSASGRVFAWGGKENRK